MHVIYCASWGGLPGGPTHSHISRIRGPHASVAAHDGESAGSTRAPAASNASRNGSKHNITVAIEPGLLRKAPVIAARKGTQC